MQRLTKSAALEVLQAQAPLIDADNGGRNPFGSSVWLRHFVSQVVTEAQSVLAVESAGDGRSLLLAMADERNPAQCASVANYYASLYTPLYSSAANRRAAIADLVRELMAAKPRIATLNLAPLDADADDTLRLAESLGDQGWYVRRYFCFGNWTLPCEGLSFDRYMEARDSQLRNTHARKARKLLAEGTLQIATRPDEVEAAMDAFDAVYARSWKQPEPYPGFVRGWARCCADQGWLRLGVARIGDVPIAAQFWFTVAGRAYIFKLAYDEAQAKWSAGTVLTAHMMRHALDVDRVVEVDYLTGDDAYKSAWMTHRRERIGLMACNLRTMAGLRSAAVELASVATAQMRGRRVPAAA